MLLVHRVCELGWKVVHAARAQGVSRQCAHSWVSRYRAEGEAGLEDRSSRPHRCPNATPAMVESQIIKLRQWSAPGSAESRFLDSHATVMMLVRSNSIGVSQPSWL